MNTGRGREGGSERRWWLVCLGLAAAVILPALAISLPMPFWRNADADLMFAYQGLLLNDGLGQDYFDHPGVPAFVLLATWYRVLHALHLLPLDRLHQLPPVSDRAAFETAWQQLVVAGRLLSMGIETAFVAGFASAVRRLARSARIGAMAGIALAFGVGITTQASMLRDELLASLFVTGALSALLLASRTVGWRRDALFGLAGLCCGLALACKVQAIFLLAALPVILLPFGACPRDPAPPRLASLGSVLLVVVAIVTGVPALRLVADGVGMLMDGRAVDRLQPLHGLSGLYQGLLLAWAGAGVVVYAAVWRAAPVIALRALAALAAGASVAILLLARTAPGNLVAVVNPIETMMVWSTVATSPGGAAGGHGPGLAIVAGLGAGLVRTIALRTVVLHPDNVRQTVVVEWLAIAGVVAAWRSRNWRTVAQVGLLLLTAWGFEVIASLRGFKRAYAIFTDPMIVLAAALVAARHRALFERFWACRRLRAGAIGLYVVAGLTWPVVSLHRGPGPRAMCGWQAEYMRRVPRFPVCGAPAR